MKLNKAIFIVLAMLVITLTLLFYVRNGGIPEVRSLENQVKIIAPQYGGSKPNSNLGQNKPKNSEKNYLKITFLDIGQGDASFIEWSKGTQMLVDCGKDTRILEALGRAMSFYDKTIDYLLVTHPDMDHYGGCTDVLKRFDVKNIIYTGLQKEDKSWQYFWQEVGLEGAEYIEVNKMEEKEIEETVLRFLYPDKDISENLENDNNSSIVFKLSFGGSNVLFTGDAEEELEKYLLEQYGEELDVEVLKVGHHGSGSSSGEDFINMVSPKISTISVGAENTYGHPSRRVLKRLERAGSEIWRTDEVGDISLRVYQDNVEIVSK